MSRFATRAAALVAALGLCAAPTLAIADDDPGVLLDRAQHAMDDLEYESAGKLAAQALAAGNLERSDLARAHRLAGEVAGSLGDNPAARDHFVRWILLEPTAALRDGTSPKIVEPFTIARGEAARLGEFTMDVQVAREKGKVVVTLTAHDPLQMVSGMRLRLGDASEVTVNGTSAVLPTADAAAVDVAVTVIDDHGDALSRLSFAGSQVDTGGGGAEVHAGPVTRVHHSIPAPVRWPTWAVLAVAGAGAGGYFAYRVGKDQDDLDALNASSSGHSFDEALAIQERGDRDALLTNVAFGVAGAAALATIVTLVLDHKRVEILPAPSGSTGASAALHF